MSSGCLYCVTDNPNISSIKEQPFYYIHGFCDVVTKACLGFVMSRTSDGKTQMAGEWSKRLGAGVIQRWHNSCVWCLGRDNPKAGLSRSINSSSFCGSGFPWRGTLVRHCTWGNRVQGEGFQCTRPFVTVTQKRHSVLAILLVEALATSPSFTGRSRGINATFGREWCHSSCGGFLQPPHLERAAGFSSGNIKWREMLIIHRLRDCLWLCMGFCLNSLSKYLEAEGWCKDTKMSIISLIRAMSAALHLIT